MIQISRQNIRTIRIKIRRALGITSSRRAPTTTMHNAGGVLRTQTASATIALEARRDSAIVEATEVDRPVEAFASLPPASVCVSLPAVNRRA